MSTQFVPYANFDLFSCADSISGGVIPVDPNDSNARKEVCTYLIAASRYIQGITRRDFVPYQITKKYPIPHRFNDLSMRRYVRAPVRLDADLLEAFEVVNADNEVLTPDEDYFLLETNFYPKYEIELQFPNYWKKGFFFTNYKAPVISVTGIWGYHDDYNFGAWEDTTQVVPAGGITASTNPIVLDDGAALDACGAPYFTFDVMYRIDNEFLTVKSVDELDADSITFNRGVRGSTAAIHAAGTKIYRWRVLEQIQNTTMQIAKIWREFQQAAGGRLGIGDYQASVELGVPGDAQTIIKKYIRSIL